MPRSLRSSGGNYTPANRVQRVRLAGTRTRLAGRLTGAFIGCSTLALLGPVPGWAGQASAAVTGVSPDATVTINGPAVALKVTKPGKAAKLTFSGKAGQRVSEDLADVNTSDGCADLSLLEPGGATLDSNNECGVNGTSMGMGPDTLPSTGTYTVELSVNSGVTGGGTLWVSAPVVIGTVAVNGSDETLKATRVGQDVGRTFTAKAGQSVSEVLTGVDTTNGCADLSLLEPGGATLDSNNECGVNGSTIGLGPDTLPVPGTYTVELSVGPTDTGGGSLLLSAPVTIGTTAVNKPRLPLKVTRYGQDVARTFTGKAGQSVTEVLTKINTGNGCAELSLIEPGGATLDSNSECGVNGSTVGVGPDTLPVPGTYEVLLSVNPTVLGGGGLLVSAPVTVGTVTVNGPAEPLKVTRYGQYVERTFSGKSGQSVTEVLSQINTTNGCADLSLIEPNGSTLDSSSQCGVNGSSITVGPDKLPATGTYAVLLSVATTVKGGGELKVSR
jgi:large repetitive protein